MSSRSQATILASLRAKTDRELIVIIDSALERGLDLLRRAANGAGEPYRAKAAQAHAEAAKLLPVAYGLSGWERFRLERKLTQLRSALDGLAEKKPVIPD